MKFSTETYERLIELVRQTPCLYDPSHPQYKDNHLQKNSWQIITTEMDIDTMTWQDWKRIWRQKRDTFIRKRREIEIQFCPLGAAASDIQKTPFYKQMTFLNVFVKRRSFTPDSMSTSGGNITSQNNLLPQTNSVEEPITATENLKRRATNYVNPMPFKISRKQDTTGTSSIAEIILKLNEKSRSNNTNAEENQLLVKTIIAEEEGATNYVNPMPMKIEETILKLNEESRSNSNSNADKNQQLVKTIIAKEDKKCNIFDFMSEKMSSFPAEVQGWLEDEALKLLIEAKRLTRMDEDLGALQQ